MCTSAPLTEQINGVLELYVTGNVELAVPLTLKSAAV
jgi:hypothetical protein